MKIHPVAWFIIGLVITIYSKVVELVNDQSNLQIFFWIGIVFMLVGIAKKFWDRENKKLEEKPF